MSSYDAAVVGGGHNGLVCAFYLAKAGRKVVVLERRSVVGGAAVTEEFHPGFRNSLASYTVSLLNPQVVRDMGLKERGLKFVKRPVANFLPIDQNRYLTVGGGLERTQAAFSEFSAKDAERLPEYYRRIDAVADVLRQLAETRPPKISGGLPALLKLAWQVRDVLRADIAVQNDLYDLMTKSARSFLDGWFENEHIKSVFGFDAVVGNYASPDTPGSAYVLLHHVFGELDGEKGAWGHAVGGMGAITQNMAQACVEVGVKIRTDAEVTRVLTDGKFVNGIVLAGGEQIKVQTVAANVTPKLLYQKLMSPEDMPADFAQKIASTRYGSGTFRLNVALSELPNFTCLPGTDLQEHHQSGIIMAPTLDYMDRAFIDAKQQGWANEPIVEMLIPSTVDDSLAPPGQHVCSLFCQQFAPTLSNGQSWDDLKPKAVEAILSLVNSYAPNFKASILGMRVLSPLDLERELGLTGGDIFHGAMTLDQLWAARPVFDYGDYRGPINGLYHCGSGAHPGGGVTGLPGKNAAAVILGEK